MKKERCTKKRLSKEDAYNFITYLNKNKRKVNKKRKEVRYYHCPLCSYWHTTKHEEGYSNTIKDIDVLQKDRWDKLLS
jgi:hypothetical protein